MISYSPGMAVLVDGLLEVLDRQVELLMLKCAQTERLSEAMLRRDEDALEDLLEQMERTQDLQAQADQEMERARKALAATLGMPSQELKLADLVGLLPEDQARAVGERRGRIVDLAERLRGLHGQTAFLLNECARINRMLLEGLLRRDEPVTTYDADGTRSWRCEGSAVDTEI